MLFAAVLLFLCGICVAVVLGQFLCMRRWYIHASVAVALFPLAAIVGIAFTVSAQALVEYIHGMASTTIVSTSNSNSGASTPQSGTLLSMLRAAMLCVRPIDGRSLTMLDIQLVAILLFLCYAAVLLLRHLVDISRLLKISRRRLFMN
ncbi:hypothetical protein LSM04_005825 [Trypanosoma melophagium]|uniref:uncharacterized protein n=1 Tax=Trypanosoma melophagium TaxID=715481 RepID=UPI00351A8E5B|nr:hypothetical protein LSM04_005825 [Trypanosoma melophagium]